MGKKRKASGRSASEPMGPREVDAADARLGPVTTYQDLADSEDEFQDRIEFDDDDGRPRTKRQRQLEMEQEPLDVSDEEVLGFSDDDDDADADDQEMIKLASNKKQKKNKRSKKNADDSDDEDRQGQEEGGQGEEDEGWWGSSRKEYYDADNIETEADAMEEEVEAKRLQKKKLAKMAEEDFLFDEDEWKAPAATTTTEAETSTTTSGSGHQAVVTEVLQEIEISDDMTTEDRLRLLQSRYPEFNYLVQEFVAAQPLLETLRLAALRRPGTSLESVKYWVLGSYVAALASYFAIFTSPARDAAAAVGNTKKQQTLSPSDLRDHEVMETLVSCRQAWQRVRDLKSAAAVEAQDQQALAGRLQDGVTATAAAPKQSKKMAVAKKPTHKKPKPALSKAVASEMADLYKLSDGLKTSSKKPKTKQQAPLNEDDSDFGEEDALDATAAAEKAARKKSLRFYTSQIVQKANKRADAGRDAGGDADIPHRERLRDRQARLASAAEKRGLSSASHGDADDFSSGDEAAEDAAASRPLDADEAYYNAIASATHNKQAAKASRQAALAAAGTLDRVVEVEELGADGKRKISYAIEKNKGLTPHRKKEVRNSRVKKRKQYDAKQKKFRSIHGTVKTEGHAGYQGEKTGINPRLVKSVKL